MMGLVWRTISNLPRHLLLFSPESKSRQENPANFCVCETTQKLTPGWWMHSVPKSKAWWRQTWRPWTRGDPWSVKFWSAFSSPLQMYFKKRLFVKTVENSAKDDFKLTVVCVRWFELRNCGLYGVWFSHFDMKDNFLAFVPVNLFGFCFFWLVRRKAVDFVLRLNPVDWAPDYCVG